MSHPTNAPGSWRILLGSLVLATGFSAWAALGGSGCASCEGAAGLLGGKALALVGVVYYGVLFVAAAALGPSLFVYSGVLLAAGVHGGLLAVLAHAKILCIPCVVTAIAALVALGSAIRCEPSNALRASLLSPAAALAVQGWILFAGGIPASAEAPADLLREPELLSSAAAKGEVRLVAYTRPDCGYCIELERSVLPALEREFGSTLTIERRSAERLPGIPTPTLILSGSDRRHLYPGLPDVEDLKSTIRELMGESHGRQTVLEKSR